MFAIARELTKHSYENLEQFEALLEGGADVNAVDDEGLTAMDHATRANNRGFKAILTKHGSRPSTPESIKSLRSKGSVESPDADGSDLMDDDESDLDMPTQSEFNQRSLAAKIAYFPRGFTHEFDTAHIQEVGIAALFTAQCGVQIGLGPSVPAEYVDELLRDLGTEFGLGLDPEVAPRVGNHLVKYAAAHDALRHSGAEAVEAIVNGIGEVYVEHIEQMGVPEESIVDLLEFAIKSCTETMQQTLRLISEHDEPPVPDTESSSAFSIVGDAQSEWLDRQLSDPKFSDSERVTTMLRHCDGARGFVRLASTYGFSVEGEDAFGVAMSGPNSKLRFTVLASRGADTIHTLSIKEGESAVQTLVDNGELAARVAILKLDEPETELPMREPKPQPTNDNNPLVLAVHAGDLDAVKAFLAQGWSTSAPYKDGSLIRYANDNQLHDIAAALDDWKD